MSELNYKINYTSMIDALQMGGTAGLESLRSSRTTRGLGTKLDTEKYVEDEEKPSLQKRILDSMDTVKKENESMAEKMKALGVEKDPVTGDLVRMDSPPKKPTKISKTSGVSVDSAYEISFKLMDDLKRDYNLTTEQAAAFAGNLWHETMGFQAFQELKPVVKGSKGGLGYAQWTGPRRTDFEAYLENQGNLSEDDYTANYGFLKQELNTTKKKVLETLGGQVARAGKEIVSIEEATKIISKNYLSPGTPRMDRRISAAKDILQRYKEDRSLK